MKKIIMLCTVCSFFMMAAAQSFTISGTLTDGATGEQLVSANIYNPDTYIGTVSNFYGFYSIKVPAGRVKLVYSFVGYESIEMEFTLSRDTMINLALKQDLMIEEVTISDKSPEARVRSTQMSISEIPMIQVKKLPAFFGEVDVIKAIQLLPGVESGTEGLSGMYVRGGGADQNLILLDGVPVYNVNHLFGFFSVFNPTAIHSFKLYKGGFPARYGGRLSSVVDIKMKEGNMKEFKGEGGIGLIASNISLEGPIIKDKSSFIVSARRTYIDVLTWPIQKAVSASQGENFDYLFGYFFHDLNAKANYKFSDYSRLYVSVYAGRDELYGRYNDKWDDYDYASESQMKMKFWWGNITSALRWNYIITPSLFANVTATYSRYKMQVYNGMVYKYRQNDTTRVDEFYFAYNSGIEDLGIKVDFDYRPSSSHTILFGAENTYHSFMPGVNVYRVTDSYYSEVIDTTFGSANIYGNEFALYAEDEITVNPWLKLNVGMRFAGFNVKNVNYLSLEPRFSARVLVNKSISVKTSYARMQQNIHLLTNSSVSLPTDLWVPATDLIKPMQSWQVAAGIAVQLFKSFEFSVEGYYKEMDRSIEYKEGASYFDMEGNWQQQVTAGKGWSYGAEVMLQRMTGRTSGWVAYTLAWANRQFPEVSFGNVFPFKWDRRHNLTIAVTHKFNNRIDCGATWIYGSGYPFTFSEYMFDNPMKYIHTTTPLYSSQGYYDNQNMIGYNETRNNYRLPDYHRLDVGFNFHREMKKHTRTWSFGAYNAYSRNNAFFIYKDYRYGYSSDGTPRPPRKEIKQISFFPIIPYFKYSFNF